MIFAAFTFPTNIVSYAPFIDFYVMIYCYYIQDVCESLALFLLLICGNFARIYAVLFEAETSCNTGLTRERDRIKTRFGSVRAAR
jgi:hypothetical protein